MAQEPAPPACQSCGMLTSIKQAVNGAAYSVAPGEHLRGQQKGADFPYVHHRAPAHVQPVELVLTLDARHSDKALECGQAQPQAWHSVDNCNILCAE